jgi:hypothetical protein
MQLVTFEAAAQEDLTAIPTSSQDEPNVAASESIPDQTVEVQLLEAPSSVMDIQEPQGNPVKEDSMDLSTEHDCPTSVTVANHGAVLGNGSGEQADAPPYQHQEQELQSAVGDESIAVAIEEDETPEPVAEEVSTSIPDSIFL